MIAMFVYSYIVYFGDVHMYTNVYQLTSTMDSTYIQLQLSLCMATFMHLFDYLIAGISCKCHRVIKMQASKMFGNATPGMCNVTL